VVVGIANLKSKGEEMKTTFVTILFVLFLFVFPVGAVERPQYETQITITYNNITFQEAAKIEERIAKEHSEACAINVKIKPSISTRFTIIPEDANRRLHY